MRQGGDVVRADIFEDERGRSRGMGYVTYEFDFGNEVWLMVVSFML